MSLINDALKRAKEAQQQVPPVTPDLPLRPVEPGQQRVRHDLGLLLPAVLGAVALLVLFLVWRFAQTRPAEKPTEVAARTMAASAQPSVKPAAASPAPVIPDDKPAPPASVAQPVSTPSGAVALSAAGQAAAVAAADTQPSATTDAAPVAAAAPPKPAPLRLQAILFNPKRPSAMISGRTVFVGDRVGGMRVVAIDLESATLAGGGQTNVLSLSD